MTRDFVEELRYARSLIFNCSTLESQLSHTENLGKLLQEIRAEGYKGHWAINKFNDDTVEALERSVSRGSIPTPVLVALLKIVPVHLNFLQTIIISGVAEPEVALLAAHNVIEQHRLADEKHCDVYEMILDIMNIREDVALCLLDELVVKSDFYGMERRAEVVRVLNEAFSSGCKLIKNWAIAHEDLLCKKGPSNRMLMEDGIALFKGGLKLFGTLVMQHSASSAEGRELLEREALCGIKLSIEEVSTGRIEVEALVSYLYRAPSLEFPLEIVKQPVSLRVIDNVLGNRIQNISEDRFLAVTKQLMSHCITDAVEFENMTWRHLSWVDKLPEGFLQDIYNAAHPRFLDRHDTAFTFVKSGANQGVHFDNEIYSSKIKPLFEELSSRRRYSLMEHINIMTVPAFIEMIPKPLFIEVTDRMFSGAPAQARRRITELSPQWLLAALPSLKKDRLSQDLDI